MGLVHRLVSVPIANDDVSDADDPAVDIQSLYMAEDVNGLIGFVSFKRHC